MAFWLRPGEKSNGNPAKNTTVLSNHILRKKVTIGFEDLPNVIQHMVTFTIPEVIVVSGNGSFTISGISQTNIMVPSAPNLCVIFGTIHNAGGNDLEGLCVQAFATTDPPQAVGGIQLGDPLAETTTDQNGFFQLELIRLSEVRFVIEEAGIDFIRIVPDLASQDLTTWT